ncbi:GILT-like protein 1 [Anthonomus grandis grandis]|uniref:GILT-like protein 1 n=1 Tax=Anthonomus grandis grandis TaxID=2921223 RepID=UPI0021666306|nr:GILT-like protein 1 [Anthonomus grandis grandis]XP_050314058.1 GILT-like protein 1 [Anthonomus grandis grandis]
MNPRYSKTILLLVLIIILYKAFKSYIFPGRSLSDEVIVRDQDENEVEKVKVSVYYEALCPDSKHFINHQVVPVFDALNDNILLDLVPYGKAQTTISDAGVIEFTCQHGSEECFANKIHACVIDLVKDPKMQLKYISCMITDNFVAEDAGERCGKEQKLDFTPIRKCATEQAGSILLKKYGERTHALNPKARFIPTILMNDSQNYDTQAIILKDLLKAVCKVFHNKPKECVN